MRNTFTNVLGAGAFALGMAASSDTAASDDLSHLLPSSTQVALDQLAEKNLVLAGSPREQYPLLTRTADGKNTLTCAKTPTDLGRIIEETRSALIVVDEGASKRVQTATIVRYRGHHETVHSPQTNDLAADAIARGMNQEKDTDVKGLKIKLHREPRDIEANSSASFYNFPGSPKKFLDMEDLTLGNPYKMTHYDPKCFVPVTGN